MLRSFGHLWGETCPGFFCQLKIKNLDDLFSFLFMSKIEPYPKSRMMFGGKDENHGKVIQVEICVCSFI